MKIKLVDGILFVEAHLLKKMKIVYMEQDLEVLIIEKNNLNN